jgi:hypothetical protein
MITIYKKKPGKNGLELVTLNDVFFNRYTAQMLDKKAGDIIEKIDSSKMVDKYTISSKFDGTVLNSDKMSTGCKTVLNIIYNPNKIFDISECGDNALDVIYSLPKGNVYCSYPFISFDMDKVYVCDNSKIREIDSYDELKEWWTNED